jgi:hypothetical protein
MGVIVPGGGGNVTTAQLDAATALRVAKAGDSMSGPLTMSYAGPATDVLASRRETIDPNNRWEALANGQIFSGPGSAPPDFGVHNNGAVGAGSDFQIGQEKFLNTAWGRFYTFARTHMTDGTRWLLLTAPAPGGFPLSGSPNLTVSSTAGLAASGTLTVYNLSLGATNAAPGTITYTSIVDGTTLGGCSSTGLTTDTDVTERYSDWITDSFGAPIYWLGSLNGLHVNDQITFNFAGVFPSAANDITMGFLNHALRTGAAIKFGADGNVWIQRTNDGLGNNEWQVHADGHAFTFGVLGLYASTALGLGTAGNPWGSIIISTGSELDIGTDGLVALSRGDDGLGNNRARLVADGHFLLWSVGGLFPNTPLPLGTLVNPWSTVVANAGSFLGAIAMNAHKITGLLNGSASDDAAAFGQIPTSLSQLGVPTGPISFGGFKATNLANGTAATDAAAFGQLPTTPAAVGAAPALAQGASQAGNFTAAANTLYPCSATLTATLPTVFNVGDIVGVSRTNVNTIITIAAGAGATINGAASIAAIVSSAGGNNPVVYVRATTATTWLIVSTAGTDGGLGLVVGGSARINGSLTLPGSTATTLSNDLDIAVAGKGLRVAEGANAKQGVSTLVAGTVVVANTSVTATSRIQLSIQSLGTVTTPKAIGVTARTAGTSFTITSADATDTSVVAWEMFEVG